MKKILFAALFVSTLTTAFAKTNDDRDKAANKVASSSFNANFRRASNVTWTESSRFTMATFTLNGKIQYAYYDLSGKFLGSTRNIPTTELPAELAASLKKQYSKYWVSELFVLENDQETTYYVRVEDGNGSRVLRSNDTLSWDFYNVSLPQGKQ